MALWQSKQTYDENAGYALSTHCYRDVFSAIVTHLRTYHAAKRKGAIEAHGVCEAFEDEVIGSTLVDEIRRLIPELADLFLDKHLAGLTLKELAAKYGLSERQVRYRLDKAQKALQQDLRWESA